MSIKLKALIVDDDPVLRMILNKELSSVGITSEAASNGVEALELMKTFSPDFILMDISMPEQDGLDTTRWIRDLPSLKDKNVPIFAVTSFGQPEHTQELLASGFNEHLIKPFNLERLVEILKKYFKD
jgi:CheY-like chemotaxis protein